MKKITAMMLAVALSVSAFIPAVKAESEDRTEVYEQAAECLDAIGAVKYDESIDFSAYITREEFCCLITDYFDFDKTASSSNGTTPFLDVEPTRESFASIKTLYDRGYIPEIKSRRFMPEDNITVADAATIMVNILGYYTNADSKGGYPNGYITVAYEKGIFTETIGDYKSQLTYGNVYKMLCDVLDVAVPEWKITGGEIGYTVNADNTVLKEYFKTEELKGIVTGTKYTSLTDPLARTASDEITIDGITYKSASDFSDMLGLYVRYYVSYYDDKNEGKVVYITEKQNNIKEINSDNFGAFEESRMMYYPNGKDEGTKKYLNLSDGLDIIYNGCAYTGYGALSDIKINSGNIKWIDNDNDNKADILSITEYENFYIDSLDKTNRIVYDYDNNKNLKMHSSEAIVEIFDAEGTKISFSDLKKGDLISVAKSETETEPLIRAYVVVNVVSGKIEQVDEDYYYIGGTAYKKSYDMVKELSMNMEGDFLLDITGKIAVFIDSTSDDYTTAVVYKYLYNFDEQETNIILFTKSETFEQYVLRDKVSINGISIRSETPEETEYIQDLMPVGSVIRYKINSDNLLYNVRVPLAMRTDSDGNKVPVQSDDFRVIFEGSSFKYRNGLLDGELVITSDTEIFSLPKDEEWNEKSKFGMLSTSSFSGGSSYSKSFIAYAIGDNDVNIADVMIIRDMSKGSIGNSTNMVLVTKVMNSISDDNEMGILVKGVAGGNTVEYFSTDSTVIEESGIARGDIIRVGVDSNGYITKVQKIYNADESNLYGALLAPNDGVCENTSSFDSEFRVVIGTVDSISDNYMRFTMRKLSNGQFYDDPSICRVSGPTVIKYETDNSNAVPSVCSVNDIIRGDKIIVRMSLADAKEIIILR